MKGMRSNLGSRHRVTELPRVHGVFEMDRRASRLTSPAASRRAKSWLAAAHDARLRPTNPIAPIDAPELPMTISFEGLSDAEQRAALAAFPGGKRFVLQG